MPQLNLVRILFALQDPIALHKQVHQFRVPQIHMVILLAYQLVRVVEHVHLAPSVKEDSLNLFLALLLN
jgi:hypothetical protein